MQKVLVVDYGAQYAQLIARRVRECHVYSEIVPHDTPVDELAAQRPAGIILSGGPKSVYSPGAPDADPRLFALGVPVLGICYGQQVMARALGGEVARTGVAEFGKTELKVTAPGWCTDLGPPDRMIPAGLRAAISSTGASCGTISEYTWHSRTRRAISCAYWAP